MADNNRKILAMEPIVWEGDLSDDCTAIWAGLMLRTEWMNNTFWWWAVYDLQKTTNKSTPLIIIRNHLKVVWRQEQKPKVLPKHTLKLIHNKNIAGAPNPCSTKNKPLK